MVGRDKCGADPPSQEGRGEVAGQRGFPRSGRAVDGDEPDSTEPGAGIQNPDQQLLDVA